MKNKWINSERVVPSAGFLFLLIAVIVSLVRNGDKDSVLELIPHNPEIVLTSYIIPVVHIICCFMALFLIFKPSINGECLIMIIESTLTILTGNEILGIFFFYGAVILYKIDSVDRQKAAKAILPMLVLHIIIICTSFLKGWDAFLMNAGCSTFFLFFFMRIYNLLQDKFSYFLPKSVLQSSIIKEEPGQVIHLKDYGLTERQANLTKDYIATNPSYKELAEKYITSLSSIKKEFSSIFPKLGVNNIQEMNFLLVQYKVEL